MLASLVRFADDTAGLEKTLRLFQGFCTLAVGFSEHYYYDSAGDVEFYVRMRGQFALGRRYFRLLKWYPCWSNAYRSIVFIQNSEDTTKPPLRTALEVCKGTFLGLYFFLEMFTISNAMGATSFSWVPRVQQEANKCWFYALVFSILLSLYELWTSPEKERSATKLSATPSSSSSSGSVTPSGARTPVDGTTDEKEFSGSSTDVGSESASTAPSVVSTSSTKSASKLYSQLLIDTCDLFIPGAAVGWIPAGPIVVGTASTISTTVAGRQIWKRVQQNAHPA
ncbi:hypothetical protein DOTSEDRAFT_177660 [Lecanosticta acicola]|uniref:Peroxisomal biogenesis factor 11 n=1 Tax=Lecanosticta acicola TaxID=111012 RepID=A0AAI8YVK3_9PEZI|nr:hypothetical protein DOTSEDRAFT_177660 [Lecanosticta acicola]